MKPVLIAGISIVNLALISYTIAIVIQSRKKMMSRNVLTFLTIGVIFDITATICMIVGTEEGPMTLHGFIGYSSLAGMIIDTIFSYRHAMKDGINALISKRFNLWSQTAYIYWIVAYITGALIVAFR
ncbi:MAG: hypothetical protein IH596_08585 [Bacteroidales bacterium]|nr:hypothetical protein [Bacteroidales bacterium]